MNALDRTRRQYSLRTMSQILWRDIFIRERSSVSARCLRNGAAGLRCAGDGLLLHALRLGLADDLDEDLI
jgi:hypothetical protein